MTPGPARKLEVAERYVHQNARQAVTDIYDALVELITNADDRYAFLLERGESIKLPARIEIEVERRRKEARSIVRVRDFADGMTLEVMENKLGALGRRVSGMEAGYNVRGTNCRGAKDIAVLGRAIFDSIAQDGKHHRCEITSRQEFIPHQPSERASRECREELHLNEGTGTLVTLEIESPEARIPNHDTLKANLRKLVAIRDIIAAQDRVVILRDPNQNREDTLQRVEVSGKPEIKERFIVPGYPDAEVKLIIERSYRRYEDRTPKFRLGGILIKSRRAVHEATLFAKDLENDPHADWFVGRLRCSYIDTLWNSYDERFENQLAFDSNNPFPIIDPFRKQGLTRNHPFTKALFQECLKRLRPLVEAERKRQESQRQQIESSRTRQRLDALEKLAAKFMDEENEDDETARDPDESETSSPFKRKGFLLSPPFLQIVLGHSARCWLSIRQEAFPEHSAGDTVEVACLTDDVAASERFVPLEAHPSQDGVLRAVWLITGRRTTQATGVRVTIGSIAETCPIEVLASEREKYADIIDLRFHRKSYSVIPGQRKRLKLLAPVPSIVESPTIIDVSASHAAFSITGSRMLMPKPEIGIAVCDLYVTCDQPGLKAFVAARLDKHCCRADIACVDPPGSGIQIRVQDEEFGNQRYRWRHNILEIGAKHPSVRRYLGMPPEFEGQEEKHFRVLLAEIVAEAVCQIVLSRKATARPEEFEDADWDIYYAEYSALTTKFLPRAHESQVSDP